MADQDSAPETEPGGTATVDRDSERVWAELHPRVRAAVRRACPYWLDHQADDLVQTVMVQLMGTPSQSSGECAFSYRYLEKAAYGAIVDEIRRQHRRPDSQASPGPIERTASANEASPERHAESEQIARGIQDCLIRLVRPRRLAVTLYLQGCGIVETARRIGWNSKRAENLIYRGLVDLRQCLERKGLKP